jgi:hypothetical protein
VKDDIFFELFPFRNCEFENNENLVTVLFKNKEPTIVEKIFFRRYLDKPYRIDLDEIGSYIWKLCDGNNNINAIVDKSRKHFGEKIEPAENRVKTFIKQLNRNKLIQLYEKR